ncbi:hypothetical protein N0824_03479 [Microcystis sp. 0824]|nr:hypothetical protein N0824_03479 [Microcystis sp. 0824]
MGSGGRPLRAVAGGVGRINKNNLRPPADRLISTSNLNYEQLINPELKPKNPQLGTGPSLQWDCN